MANIAASYGGWRRRMEGTDRLPLHYLASDAGQGFQALFSEGGTRSLLRICAGYRSEWHYPLALLE